MIACDKNSDFYWEIKLYLNAVYIGPPFFYSQRDIIEYHQEIR